MSLPPPDEYAPGAIELSGIGDAVRGVLGLGNGGTENEWGLSRGVAYPFWIASNTDVPYGTLMAIHGSGAAPCTTAASSDVLGPICDPEGAISHENGLIQVSGAAVVLATGAIEVGDYVQSSATAGTCQKATDFAKAFGRAISAAVGGYVTVAMQLGDTMSPDSWPSHHALSHLTDGDDHTQYLLRRELAVGEDLALGVVPTGWSADGAHDPTNPANLTDGDDATASGLMAGAGYQGYRFDFTTPVTLDNFSLLGTATLPGFSGSVGWRVRTSDDGTSWTTLYEAAEADWADVSGGAGTTWRLVRGHPRATSRYWELALNMAGLVFGNLNTLLWRRMPAGSHRLFSDEHADVDVGAAPTVGDGLIWNGTKFAPAAAASGYGDIDGGTPTSVYGGVGALIDCGGV